MNGCLASFCSPLRCTIHIFCERENSIGIWFPVRSIYLILSGTLGTRHSAIFKPLINKNRCIESQAPGMLSILSFPSSLFSVLQKRKFFLCHVYFFSCIETNENMYVCPSLLFKSCVTLSVPPTFLSLFLEMRDTSRDGMKCMTTVYSLTIDTTLKIHCVFFRVNVHEKRHELERERWVKMRKKLFFEDSWQHAIEYDTW